MGLFGTAGNQAPSASSTSSSTATAAASPPAAGAPPPPPARIPPTNEAGSTMPSAPAPVAAANQDAGRTSSSNPSSAAPASAVSTKRTSLLSARFGGSRLAGIVSGHGHHHHGTAAIAAHASSASSSSSSTSSSSATPTLSSTSNSSPTLVGPAPSSSTHTSSSSSSSSMMPGAGLVKRLSRANLHHEPAKSTGAPAAPAAAAKRKDETIREAVQRIEGAGGDTSSATTTQAGKDAAVAAEPKPQSNSSSSDKPSRGDEVPAAARAATPSNGSGPSSPSLAFRSTPKSAAAFVPASSSQAPTPVRSASVSGNGAGASARRKEYRWGIIGCTPTAARFAKELVASQEGRHRIIAISGSTQPVLRDFVAAHMPDATSSSVRAKPSRVAGSGGGEDDVGGGGAGTPTRATMASSLSAPVVETYTTLTELLTHPAIDAVLVASPQQNSRHAHAKSALRAGKSVLVARPIAMSAAEARELCALAEGGFGHNGVGGSGLVASSQAAAAAASAGGVGGAQQGVDAMTSGVQTPRTSLTVSSPGGQGATTTPVAKTGRLSGNGVLLNHHDGEQQRRDAARRFLGIVLRRVVRPETTTTAETTSGRGGVHAGDDEIDWLAAADEAATCSSEGRRESANLPWKESISVLEALDTVRKAGGLVIPQDEAEGGSMILSHGSYASARPFPSTEATLDPTTVSPLSPPLNGTTGLPLGGGVGRTRRSSSRLSMNSDASVASAGPGEDGKAALRAQVHELRHVLRQKNVLISSLEEKAGLVPGSSATFNLSASGRSSSPQVAGMSVSAAARPRRSSLGPGTVSASSASGAVTKETAAVAAPLSPRPHSPAGSISSLTIVGAGGATTAATRRRRRSGGGAPGAAAASTLGSGAGEGLSAAANSVNQLSPVREANQSNLALGEGFLSPTIASENRRVAGLLQQAHGLAANAPATEGASGAGAASAASGGGTGKVIQSLTMELEAARSALDATKAQLRSSQRNASSLQRSLDETKSALARSRAENEHVSGMMQRKERQVAEALERARRAETEAKELGRSSREWGTRVRQVEAELGEERKRKQKAESGYETITAAWKSTREAWRKELDEVRKGYEDKARERAEEVRRVRQTYEKLQDAWKDREGERASLDETLRAFAAERAKAEETVTGRVAELVTKLEAHERATSAQDAEVKAVHDELRRILRLMRQG